jgi:hypothetical protein
MTVPQRRNRTATTVAIFQGGLSAALAVAVVVLAISNSQLYGKAQQITDGIHASQVKSCVSGNKTRTETGRILDEIIALTPAASHAKMLTARADVASNYRTQDCARLYRAK